VCIMAFFFAVMAGFGSAGMQTDRQKPDMDVQCCELLSVGSLAEPRQVH